MRFLTLNIGASKALLAEYVQSGKGKLSLAAYGTGDLAGIDVNDPAALSAALPPVLHQIVREKGIKPGPLVVSLSGQMVFPRFAKFPPLGDKAKLEQLVGYEIEQNVPFPIDEVVSDWQFLGQTPEGDQAALIVAAKLEGVRAVTEAAISAGFKPMTVDVSPIAVCNAFRASGADTSGCTVVLDIGAKTTNLIILEDEKIYNRSIPVAGNAITKEIMQTFGCTFEEAEQLKLERGYVSMGGVTEDADETTDHVAKCARTVLTRLHVEISRSINFYRSQQGGSAPSRFVLTGGSVRLPQMDQFFSEALQVEVEYLNPFGAVAFGPKVDAAALESDAFILAESVGLALRPSGQAAVALNLMPPELVEQARALRRIPFIAAGAVAFLAALGAAWFAETHKTDVAQAQLECVEGRNNAFKGLEAKLKAEQKAELDARARCDEFQQLLWQRSAALLRLRAVRESLIPGMWITEWQPYKPRPKDDEEAVGLGGARVTIRGWRDAMRDEEAKWSKSNGGKKATAATIVESRLKGKQVFNPDDVKIVSQKDVKDCLSEFTIQIGFAPAPSVAPDATPAGGRKGKGKGARK